MTPAEHKAALRREALARRAALPSETRAAFAERLAQEGLALAERLSPAAVSAFHAFRDEPDTLPLLGRLADAGYVTAIPVTGRRGESLVFRRWRPGEPTVPGQWRIPEPPPLAPALDPDLLFVPLSVFDRRGQRIGYGAGHYDLSLALLKRKKPVVAVGVAFSVCEAPEVPAEPHDEPLDFVLTDKELLDLRSAR